MPKIKLKPNLSGIEIGIGNVLDLKIKQGEIVEVAEEFLADILGLGHFDRADQQLSRDQKEDEDGTTGNKNSEGHA